MYAEKPQDFSALLSPCPEQVQGTAVWLRTFIAAHYSQLTEDIYGGTKVGIALYHRAGDKNDVVFGIQPAKDHVKLYVHNVNPQDSGTLKLEGKGKTSKHIKFFAPAEELESELLSLVPSPAK